MAASTNIIMKERSRGIETVAIAQYRNRLIVVDRGWYRDAAGESVYRIWCAVRKSRGSVVVERRKGERIAEQIAPRLALRLVDGKGGIEKLAGIYFVCVWINDDLNLTMVHMHIRI